jgi:glucokinase
MIIGVDLGGTNARAGLVENGRILESRQIEWSNKLSLDNTLQELFSIISPLDSAQVEGIGIGVPSVVDPVDGIVYDVVNIPSWRKVALKKILQERFGKPVFVNNDVNCFALGEQLFGQAASFSSFVALGLGTGLGAAIVIDYKLYLGLNCGSGEIGYIPYLDKNLEYYASGMFFEKFSTTAQACFMAALEGEKKALDIWASYGHHLGQVMKVVLYTYAPEAIILGGGLSNAFRFYETAMQQAMEDFIYGDTLKKLKILRSSVENVGVMGAAALVFSNQSLVSR